MMAALPEEILQQDPLKSIWFMHAQPPLFNLYGAITLHLFGRHHYVVMEITQILMGAAISGLAYFIAVDLLSKRWLAVISTLVFVVLNASLFVYETGNFYTIHTAFLATCTVFFIRTFTIHGRMRHLYAFVMCANLLVMVRTLYHLVFLAGVIFLAGVMARDRWRRVLIVSLMISTFSFGWYLKNWVNYGFFGETSWAGFNLWRIVSQGYTVSELEDLVEKGELHAMVVNSGYFRPPAYFTDYGYDDTSPVAALSQQNFHNIVYTDVGPVFFNDALRLIRTDPLHYLVNVARAYRIYVKPSFDLQPNQMYPVPRNANKIGAHVTLYRRIVYGDWIASALQKVIGVNIGSVIFGLLPVSLGYYFLYGLKRANVSLSAWVALIREKPLVFYIVALISYTTVVSCLFEYGENNRFKVPVEPVLWLLIVAALKDMASILVSRRFKLR